MTISQVIVLPTCAICQDDDHGVLNIVVTKCGHIFHSHCLEEWHRNERALRGGIKCPYCNTGLEVGSFYSRLETSNTTRLHQLTTRRVVILSDGDPCPEEQIKKLQLEIASIKLDLENESLKVRAQEAENTELVEKNKALLITVNQLREQCKSYCENTDDHVSQLKRDQELHQKESATYLEEEEILRNWAKELKDGEERVQVEVKRLSEFVERKEIERSRRTGLAASQGGTIRILEAQVAELNRETHQLSQMIDVTRESQRRSDGNLVESGRSHHLMNVMLTLSGRFSKLQSDYSTLKKQMLEVKDDGDDQSKTPDMDKSVTKESDHGALQAVIKNPLKETSVPKLQSSSEHNINQNKGKGKAVEELVERMNSLEVPTGELTENMDPRLYA
ncbi:hypothetical protein PGT21_024244 [Puccinia graminis f. sp. tritici]|uniref:RING-type domain-containing protein n=1 Tax=Puccinia graminis f. sp. tritici TaxID=56615 RepID=A0A5B0R1F0_PUCGR|nr:hypothetical protein PGT21_024244 [Puccinia graminis f. sp. tritici]